MTATIKLDFISDVVCPWCVIGFKRLQQAINELGIQDQVEIEWQPFELNPDIPTEGESLPEHISRKYGSTAEEAKRNADQITKLGAEMGFKFDFFDGMRIVNTRDTHILLGYAKGHGKQTELKMRLFDKIIPDYTLEEIRSSINRAWVLGDDRFKRQIKSLISCFQLL